VTKNHLTAEDAFSILSTDLSQSSTVMASKPKSSVKNTLLLLNSSTVLFIARSNGISEISANINILAAYFSLLCVYLKPSTSRKQKTGKAMRPIERMTQ
jgi:hypothetical protein